MKSTKNSKTKKGLRASRSQGRSVSHKASPRDTALDAESAATRTPGSDISKNLKGTVFPRWAVPHLSIVPDVFRTELTYSDVFTVGPSTNEILGVQVFSAGGLYDPDITGSGHQPCGFDQLMTFYDHYVVTHARIEVQGFVLGASNVEYILGEAWLSVVPTASSTALTSSDLFFEHPYAVAGLCGRASGVQGDRIVCSLDIPKWFGVTEAEFIADDTHRGTASGNPSEDSYFQVGATRMAYSDASSIPVTCRARITYKVLFLERKELPLS